MADEISESKRRVDNANLLLEKMQKLSLILSALQLASNMLANEATACTLGRDDVALQYAAHRKNILSSAIGMLGEVSA